VAARIVRAAASLLAVALVAGACSGSGPPVAAGTASRTASVLPRAAVTYRVTGHAPEVVIFFGNKEGTQTSVRTRLPWSFATTAPQGITLILRAHQPFSRYGYRIICRMAVTIPGHAAVVSVDSSHIVGIKQEGGPQKVLYDGLCNTAQVVTLSGV